MKVISKNHIFSMILEAEKNGLNEIEIEYKDGYSEICAMKNGFGFGLTRIESNSKESEELFKSIAAVKKRKKHEINGESYKIYVGAYESFGETAYGIKWNKI